uniref:Uncharacterized protein n=1 Tax=Oryza meridionalis TaxID=40149 RepID=A0A0E0FAB9_9ORYZ
MCSKRSSRTCTNKATFVREKNHELLLNSCRTLHYGQLSTEANSPDQPPKVLLEIPTNKRRTMLPRMPIVHTPAETRAIILETRHQEGRLSNPLPVKIISTFATTCIGGGRSDETRMMPSTANLAHLAEETESGMTMTTKKIAIIT